MYFICGRKEIESVVAAKIYVESYVKNVVNAENVIDVEYVVKV